MDLDLTSLILCIYRVYRRIPDVIQYPADSVIIMVQVCALYCNIVQDPGFTYDLLP